MLAGCERCAYLIPGGTAGAAGGSPLASKPALQVIGNCWRAQRSPLPAAHSPHAALHHPPSPSPSPFCARSCRTSSCSAAFCSASRDTCMHAHVFDTDGRCAKGTAGIPWEEDAGLGIDTLGRISHVLLHNVRQLAGVRQDVCENVCCRHGQPVASAL